MSGSGDGTTGLPRCRSSLLGTHHAAHRLGGTVVGAASIWVASASSWRAGRATATAVAIKSLHLQRTVALADLARSSALEAAADRHGGLECADFSLTPAGLLDWCSG